MSQRTTGWRSVLSVPAVYRFSQRRIGSAAAREWFVRDVLRPGTSDRILDIGCGTGDLCGLILDVQPDVHYVGHDPSGEYIDAARARYGSQAEFEQGGVGEVAIDPQSFDICVAKGVLHHLDDATAGALFDISSRALRPGGRIITMDPVFADGQSRIARFLASRDRGQNVRTADGYRSLAEPYFAHIDATVRHDLLRVPYSHALMECARPSSV